MSEEHTADKLRQWAEDLTPLSGDELMDKSKEVFRTSHAALMANAYRQADMVDFFVFMVDSVTKHELLFMEMSSRAVSVHEMMDKMIGDLTRGSACVDEG